MLSMMPSRLRVCFVCLAMLLLGACADPMVRYEKVTADTSGRLRTLRSDQVVFGLRSTDITIVSKDPDDKACNLKAAPSQAEWARCLAGVEVLLTPTVSSDGLILATSTASANPFRKMHLYSAPLTDQLGNVSNVAFTTTDTTAQSIASIGAGAVAGSAFGPVGALFGAALAAAGARYSPQFVLPPEKSKSRSVEWRARLCDKTSDMNESPDQIPLQTLLPYFVSLDKAAQKNPCWNIVTNLKRSSIGSNADWTGWIYQLHLTPLPSGSYEESSTLFSGTSANFAPDSSKLFPFVPCQNAELRLSWGSELMKADADIAYRSIPFIVANPAYVRYLQIPATGTIKFGTVCNASVVPGVFTGSTPQADTDALLKAIADVKAARPEH